MILLFRSCGGLGNQLYQLLFCKLISDKYNSKRITHYHSTNYERYAEWEVPIEFANENNIIHVLLIKLRLPMILHKLGLNKKGYLRLFNFILIDNYYQHIDFYKVFTKQEILDAIEYIKDITISPNSISKDDSRLYHFRLGDFFENEQDESRYISQNLINLKDGSTIISNKDELFKNSAELARLLNSKNCTYQESAHLNAVELLNLFYNYKTIYSNGSSLSYFAATLSNSKVLPISESNNVYQEDSIMRLENLKNFISS